MSTLGFYGWIREGVRRAVLLGFSDAVDQLGAPVEGEEVHPQLAAVLRQPKPLAAATSASAPNKLQSGAGRRRLGRTLDQIQDGAKPQ